MYAVETIRQYEHFRFRGLQRGASEAKPLQLKKTDEWTRWFYEKGTIYERERESLMYQEN